MVRYASLFSQLLAFFKGYKTESAYKDICWNDRECSVYPDLDSIDYHAVNQIFPAQIKS